MNVGHAWAIIKNRMPGSVDEATTFLKSLSPAEGQERNRQEARTQVRVKKPYKLGESVKVRNG
jgi:hypothetical protein